MPCNTMQRMPLVSVVTPVYNGEAFLEECIQSVLAQTYEKWEFVIVDNCSSDRTASIIARYVQRDDRFRVVTNPSTVGALENHNIAVRAMSAQSTYCKILHADDRMLPACLEKMVSLAEAHPSIGMVGALARWGDAVVCAGMPKDQGFFSGQQAARHMLLQEANPFWSPSCLMHRSDAVREREYFYDEQNLHADVQSDYEILRKWDFGFVHDQLTWIRSHDESRTSTLANPLNKTLATNFEMLIDYGPGFLTDIELDGQIERQLNHYYKQLAVSAYQCRGLGFWRFHSKALRASGYPLSTMRLLQACVREFVSSPLRNCRRLLRWAVKKPIVDFMRRVNT